MSLINDALKRASQTDKEQPREAVVSPAPMVPVRAPQQQSPSKLPLLAGLGLTVGIAVAGVCYWLWPHKEIQVTAAPAKPKVLAAAPKQEIKTAPVAPPQPAPVAKPVAVDTPAAPVPAIVASVSVTQAIATNLPAFPQLSLKAIIYRSKDPLAIINGRTVGIGDEIEGVSVTVIQRQKVIVTLNGRTRELFMD